MLSDNRNGNFTSSGIVALTTKGKAKGSIGKPYYTYIKSRKRERKLKRSIEVQSNAKPLSWGKLVEKIAFDQLGYEYELTSRETIFHESIPNWCGTPDGKKRPSTTFDIKCPISIDSYCDYADCVDINEVRKNTKLGEENYWQIVSNSILQNTTHGELIIFVPYKSQLAEIRELADNFDGDQNKIAWINWANDEDLPYLHEDGDYKNIVIFRFEIPQADKEFLTSRVLSANELLNQ